MDVTITSNADAFKDELRNVIPKILESWGVAAEGYAKLSCPTETGRLKNSITHERDDEKGQVQIGTNVEYAPYVEYGTGKFAKEGGRQTPWRYRDLKGNWHTTSGTRPQPFLTPAILDNISEYQDIADEYLKGE